MHGPSFQCAQDGVHALPLSSVTSEGERRLERQLYALMLGPSLASTAGCQDGRANPSDLCSDHNTRVKEGESFSRQLRTSIRTASTVVWPAAFGFMSWLLHTMPPTPLVMHKSAEILARLIKAGRTVEHSPAERGSPLMRSGCGTGLPPHPR